MRAWGRGDWMKLACLAWAGLALAFAVLAFFNPHAHSVYPIYAGGAALVAGRGHLRPAHGLLPLQPAVRHRADAVRAAAGQRGALWKAFNLAVYAAGLASACRHLLPTPLTRNQRGALWLLALPLSFHSMYNGQANLIMLGTLLFGLSAAARGHWNRAALFLALATLVKGYPLALALLLSALYLRKFALRYVLFLAAGLLLPFATQPPSVVAEQYASWFRHLNDSTVMMRERLRSLDYILLQYGHPISSQAFNLLSMLGGAGVLAVCLLWARRLADPRALLTRVFLLFATWVVLLGPATESCTYVILGPAIAWAVVEAFSGAGGRTRRALLLASLFLMGPSVTDLVGHTLRRLAYAYAAQPLGAVLFLGLLLTQALKAAAPAAEALSPDKSPARRAA